MRSRLARLGAVAALLLAAAPARAQQQVTLIGCVEPEKEYRSRMNATKGGPLGTDVGQGNEFVLSSAKAAPANGSAQTRKEAVATSGQSGDYELTGKTEPDLKQALGRQIEVTGVVQPFEVHDSAKDSRDRLPRLMVSSWHRVADSCTGQKK
jgi:hypothetical protein